MMTCWTHLSYRVCDNCFANEIRQQSIRKQKKKNLIMADLPDTFCMCFKCGVFT